MKNDDAVIPNIPEIKTISPLSSQRGQVVETTTEGKTSSSSNSSDSSLSDLKKRLQDLPSPNEFTLLADRVAALGRRICRKRELFLRLQGVVSRIDENDEWEEAEQRVQPECSLVASRPKNARARRRARIRLESSLRCDDKAMLMSQVNNDRAGASTIMENDDDKSNPISAVSSIDQSARDSNYFRLPTIETSRRQGRLSSTSEPSSTRFPHYNNGSRHPDIRSRDTRNKMAFHTYQDLSLRDSAPKSADFPSVSPFSLSSVRPKKFGGYRPSSSVVMKNLSSGSESESAVEATRGFPSTRNVGSSIVTSELSSPESKVTDENGTTFIKKTFISAKSDITKSELMSLPLSMRSLDDNNLDRQIFQDTSRNYAIVHINCDRPAKNSDELEKASRDTPEKIIYDEITSYEKLLTKAPIEPRQVELEYQDMCDEGKEISQNALTFSGRSFMSDPAELLTSIYDERVNQEEHMIKTCREFKQVKSEYDDKHDVKGEIENYRSVAPKTHHDDFKDRFDVNCSTNRSNLTMNSLENLKDLDKADWRLASLYTKEAVDTPHLIEEVKNDAAEDVSSSRVSEPFKSENHSQSSHTAKIYLQRDIFSSRRSKNDADTPNQEIIALTNVPTLALNSQDISYSTSAGSRECSAMRPLDPHALIKALSDISLKHEQVENFSRNHEDFHRQDKNMIDASSGASNFPTIGETWRVPRSPMSESSRKPLSRVPSRIPIRIVSSTIMSPANSNKLPRYYKNSENSEKIANYEEAGFIDRDDVQSEVNKNIACQQATPPEVEWSYPQRCKQDSSLRSMNENIEIMVVKAHSGTFAPDDEVEEYEANDYEPGSSNLQSPKSAPFGDHTYDKMRHLPQSRSSEKSCPSVFLNKARYASDRDYAKIDDDLRSKSDRSTSRKSAETVDVTSITESPCMSKYKQNESFRLESPRNIEENVTWRTEDECASINDEENPEVHYGFYNANDKREELYSQTKDRFKSIIEGMHNSFSSKTQLLELDLSSEMEKLAKKQSENLISQVHKTQETSGLAMRSPSTLNLNYDSKRKKKSIERFPFTISEASGALSIEHKDTSDYQLTDKSFDCTKVDQLKEKNVYQLKMHPSLTRLATSGLEDTVADILCCVSQEQKQDAMTSKSRMKAIIRIFSWKLRKAPKHQSTDNKTSEQTKVIYENRACQADSRANSCSGDSFTGETDRMNFDKSSNNVWINRHVARSNPMFVSSGNILKTESIETIAQEYPHRRYDRDDLWVQDMNDHLTDKKENNKTSQREEDTSKESTSKDRYSIFLAKKSDELLESSINEDNSSKKQHNTSGRVIPSDEKSKQNIDRNVSLNCIPEVEEVEDSTGCLCLRLCRFRAPSIYLSSVKKQTPSSARTKRSLLRKRKK